MAAIVGGDQRPYPAAASGTVLRNTVLRDTLLAPDAQPRVTADCEALVDREVAEMSGVTGAAVRLAYRTVRTFDAGHIRVMIESLLPERGGRAPAVVDGVTDGARAPKPGDFGAYLASREDEVAEALLGITDERPQVLAPGDDRQGVQHGQAERRQAREGRPARTRRAGAAARSVRLRIPKHTYL